MTLNIIAACFICAGIYAWYHERKNKGNGGNFPDLPDGGASAGGAAV